MSEHIGEFRTSAPQSSHQFYGSTTVEIRYLHDKCLVNDVDFLPLGASLARKVSSNPEQTPESCPFNNKFCWVSSAKLGQGC